MTAAPLPPGDDPRRVAEFMDLFTRHQRQIYVYALALVPHHADADDVLQEAHLSLWEQFHTFTPGTNFRAWACKIVYRKALDFYRRQKRHPLQASEQLLQDLAEEVASKSELLEARFDALNHCLTKLSDADRKLLQARYQPQAEVTAIARQLGRTPHSVSKSMSRIRQALLECVRRALQGEQHG